MEEMEGGAEEEGCSKNSMVEFSSLSERLLEITIRIKNELDKQAKR